MSMRYRALGMTLAGVALGTSSGARAANVEGRVILDVRARAEIVDQTRAGGITDEARAFTVRARFGFETPAWHR